ncbi:MAG: hypothetical protein ACJ73D_03070 [Pyrinomonadaceae bacterium]
MRLRKADVPVLGVLVAALLGCNMSKFAGNSGSNTSANASPTPTATETATPTPKPSPLGIGDTLRRSPGKYPYELKLLENKDFQARLKKIMGDDFAVMKSHFDVQTPIEVVNGIVMASGCQAHNCGNIYYIFIDPGKDNLNVIHVEDEKVTNYFEKGRIKLPEKFASQIPDIADESSD